MTKHTKADRDTVAQTLETWFDNELDWLHRNQVKSDPVGQTVALTAQYLLEYLKPFLVTAIDAYRRGHIPPALACCRTVYEAGLQLAWCLSDRAKAEGRLSRWRKKLLRERKVLCEELANAMPNNSAFWSTEASRIGKRIDALGPCHEIPDMRTIVHDIGEAAGGWSLAYQGYRRLSQSTHAAQFPEQGLGDVFQTAVPDKSDAMCFTASAAWVLVSAIQHYFGRDRSKLNDQYQAVVAVALQR